MIWLQNKVPPDYFKYSTLWTHISAFNKQYFLSLLSDETVDHPDPAEFRNKMGVKTYGQELVIDLLTMLSRKNNKCFAFSLWFPPTVRSCWNKLIQGGMDTTGGREEIEHPMEWSVRKCIWQQFYLRMLSNRLSLFCGIFSGKGNPFSNSTLHFQHWIQKF